MSDVTADNPPIDLRNPFVRAMALGRMAGILGLQIIIVAVGWELYERTGSAWALGFVGAVELAPVLLLLVPAGNLADRMARRNLAIIAQLVLALAATGLLVGSLLGASETAIYAMIALVGASRAFSAPSVGTILPQLLKPRQFVHANAWVSSGSQFAAAAGPAVGGALIAIYGSTTVAYGVAAACQFIFIGFLLTLPRIDPPPSSGRRSWAEAFAGFTFIRRTPLFLAAITLDLFAVLLGGAVALLPIFAKDILEVGPVGLGWLRAAPALGSMTMALVQARIKPWNRPGAVMLAAVVGFGLATIGFGLSENFALSMACLFLTGLFDSVSVVVRTTLEQILTPDPLRGRVSSINYVFIGMSNELGAFESGATAALFGTVASVVGGGIAVIGVVAAVMLKWPQLARIGPLHTLAPNAYAMLTYQVRNNT
ncbi:MAG: MFS transporter [Rhodospirillaceae bacterium]|nr:MFS transporter [Rhodospirillaceae bacterium]